MSQYITFDATKGYITKIDTSFSGSLVLDRKINNVDIKVIYSQVCVGGKIKSFDASKTVIERIEGEAFLFCSDLRSVSLPETVTYFGGNAFAVAGITKFVLPKSTQQFTGYSLNQAPNLVELSVAEGNQYFASKGNCIFSKDFSTLIRAGNNVQFSKIPGVYKLKQVNRHAFTLNPSTSFIAGADLSYIEEFAFHAWPCLKRVDLRISKITSLPTNLFNGCSNVAYLALPRSLVSICSSSLPQFPEIKELIIPQNVTFIAQNGIGGLKKLKHIYLLCEYQNSFEDSAILSNYINTRSDVIVHVHETFSGSKFGGFKVTKDLVEALEKRMKKQPICSNRNSPARRYLYEINY